MSAFEDYVYEEFVRQMRSWPLEVRNDIYVIVIFISLLDDDPRFAAFSLDYNTLSNWKESVSAAFDEAEAKWNYAFWLQNNQAYLCESSKYSSRPPDLKGIELRDNYLKAQLPQYDFSDAEHKFLLEAKDSRLFAYSDSLANVVVDLCGFIIRRLHESGVITEICGRAVPIGIEMLNDTGDADYCLDQIETANSAGLADDYLKWKREVA